MKRPIPPQIAVTTSSIVPTRRAAVAGLLALPLAAATAGPETTDASDAALLAVREAVWRDWFAGNRQALLAILPDNFVGIGAGEAPARTREETVADAVGFAAGGSKLTHLAFKDNKLQKLGNVVVIYCGFTFTTQDKNGASNTVSGRATEVFLRSGSEWLHPGWHLDSGRCASPARGRRLWPRSPAG